MNLLFTFLLSWSRKLIGCAGAEDGPLDWGYSSIVGIVAAFYNLSTVPFSIVTVLFKRAIGLDVFSWERRASFLGNVYFFHFRLLMVRESLPELREREEEGLLEVEEARDFLKEVEAEEEATLWKVVEEEVVLVMEVEAGMVEVDSCCYLVDLTWSCSKVHFFEEYCFEMFSLLRMKH